MKDIHLDSVSAWAKTIVIQSEKSFKSAEKILGFSAPTINAPRKVKMVCKFLVPAVPKISRRYLHGLVMKFPPTRIWPRENVVRPLPIINVTSMEDELSMERKLPKMPTLSW